MSRAILFRDNALRFFSGIKTSGAFWFCCGKRTLLDSVQGKLLIPVIISTTLVLKH